MSHRTITTDHIGLHILLPDSRLLHCTDQKPICEDLLIHFHGAKKTEPISLKAYSGLTAHKSLSLVVLEESQNFMQHTCLHSSMGKIYDKYFLYTYHNIQQCKSNVSWVLSKLKKISNILYNQSLLIIMAVNFILNCQFKKTQLGGAQVLSHSVVSNSLRPHGLQPVRLLCPQNFPGKNTRVGCHFLGECYLLLSVLYASTVP